jgi:hypothetical protein
MNWATFLVNQFLTDCIEAQEKGTKIHFARLLILIALAGWQGPSYYNHMGKIGRGNMVVQYANLWHMQNKRRQQDNSVTFFVYFDNIMYIIKHTPNITTETVETYKDIALFRTGMYHMYMQAKNDLARQ